MNLLTIKFIASFTMTTIAIVAIATTKAAMFKEVGCCIHWVNLEFKMDSITLIIFIGYWEDQGDLVGYSLEILKVTNHKDCCCCW